MLCWASYGAASSCFKALLEHILLTGDLSTQLAALETGTVTAATLRMMCKLLASWGLPSWKWSDYRAQWGSVSRGKWMLKATQPVVQIAAPGLPGKVSKHCSWVAVLWQGCPSAACLQRLISAHSLQWHSVEFSFFFWFVSGYKRSLESQCDTWCKDTGPSRRRKL